MVPSPSPLDIVSLAPAFGRPVDREKFKKICRCFFSLALVRAALLRGRFLELLFDGLSAMRKSGDKPFVSSSPGHELDLRSRSRIFWISSRCEDQTPSVIRGAGATGCSGLQVPQLVGMKAKTSGLADVPGLALAARAPSSFPGAFPSRPALKPRKVACEAGVGLAPESAENLSPLISKTYPRSVDPEIMYVLAAALSTQTVFRCPDSGPKNAPAYRDGRPPPRLYRAGPGTIVASTGRRRPQLHTDSGRGDFLKIPLRAPIYHELARVQQFNETTERMRAVLKAAYPELAGFVTTVTEHVPSTEDASRTIGFGAKRQICWPQKRQAIAYQVYARFKTFSIIDTLIGLICNLGEIDQASPLRTRLADEILTWANRRGAIPPEGSLSMAGGSEVQPWIDFLLHFDVEFPPPQAVFCHAGFEPALFTIGRAKLQGSKAGSNR